MSLIPKTKKSAPRRRVMALKADGNSPVPMGPGGSSSSMCGHSNCGSTCQVRHVGLTSRISDHHMFHAARAVANIWTAAIVAGLAVVLTGAIALTAVQAKSDQQADVMYQDNAAVRSDNVRLLERLNAMEKALNDIRTLCLGGAGIKKSSVPAPSSSPTINTSAEVK